MKHTVAFMLLLLACTTCGCVHANNMNDDIWSSVENESYGCEEISGRLEGKPLDVHSALAQLIRAKPVLCIFGDSDIYRTMTVGQILKMEAFDPKYVIETKNCYHVFLDDKAMRIKMAGIVVYKATGEWRFWSLWHT